MKANQTLDEIVSAGVYGVQRAAFITPVFFSAELISGIESEQSGKIRLFALGVNFAIAYPYKKWFKPFVENIVYRATGVSKGEDKIIDDVASRSAFVLHQIPLYSGLLYVAGASLEQAAVTLVTGLAVGAAITKKFDGFMDLAHDYLKEKLYLTEEKTRHTRSLAFSYAKNLVAAALIAVAVKLPMNYFMNEAEPAISDNVVWVYDSRMQDGIYAVKADEFNKKTQMLVYASDTSKMKK